MSILYLILVLVVAGVILYMINNYIPMDSKIKWLLNVVIVIILIVWLLKASGLWASLSNARI